MDKKSYKNAYIGFAFLGIMMVITLIIALKSGNIKSLKEDNNVYKVGTFYIPDKDSFDVESGAISVLTNKLLYNPMALYTKSGLSPYLATSFTKTDDGVEVIFKSEEDAKTVYDSIYAFKSKIYENSFLLENINGYYDYLEGSDTISGLSLDKNKLTINLINKDDLSVLTVPTILYKSTYEVKDYNKNSFIITDGNTSYEFVLLDKANVKSEDFDVLLTTDTSFTVENTQSYLINMYNDFAILNSFTEKEKEEFAGIFEGKRAKFDFPLYVWCDSSYKAALFTEKLKSNINTDVYVDYGDTSFLLKELSTDNKMVVFYEDNASDINLLKDYKNLSFVEIPSKQINVIYNKDVLN